MAQMMEDLGAELDLIVKGVGSHWGEVSKQLSDIIGSVS